MARAGDNHRGGRPLQDGQPRKMVSLRLAATTIEALEVIAAQEGRSKTEIIESLIQARYAEHLVQ